MSSAHFQSVGRNGTNRKADVMAIQAFLNNWIGQGPMRRAVKVLKLDGDCGKKTKEAITVFQFMMGIIPPTGLIKRDSLTYRKLTGRLILFPPHDPTTFSDAVLKKSSHHDSTDIREIPVDLYVLQPSNRPGDPNYEALKKFWIDKHGFHRWEKISGPLALRDLIKKRCGEKKWLRVLRIGGHGSSNSFRLGSVEMTYSNINTLKTICFDEITPYLKKGKSIIYLDNCFVGQDKSLLKNFSSSFSGIPVIAPVESQVTNEGPPAYEGKATICSDRICMPIALPNDPPSAVLKSFAGWRSLVGDDVLDI